MMRLAFLLSVFIGLVGDIALASSSAVRTNLLFIMTDDQGAWSLGCYGNPETHTPNVDTMASEGVRLTQAFAAIPVCSPSRATFYTGRIPSQHGVHDFIQKHESFGPRARYCLDNEITLSEMLAKYGYTCGISGKWHLGNSMQPRAGYSDWFVLPIGLSQYNNAEMVDNGKIVQTTGYLTDRITDRAIEFLEKNKDRLFFLNLEYNAPHSPWRGHPKALLDHYRNCPFDSIPTLPTHPWASIHHDKMSKRRGFLEQYFAACSGIDRGVGRVLKSLDELGLSDKTLVIYTSDQGFNFGHHGFIGKGNGTNPRNMYDTTLRVPMIFRHTSRLQPGRTVDLQVSVYDFLPTVLAYLGLPPSPGRNLPGRSFTAALQGKTPPNWPDSVFAEYGHTRMIRSAKYKYVHRAHGGPRELYDLQNDPDETANLIDKPEMRPTWIALRKRIFDWFHQYGEAGADPVGREFLCPNDR